MSYEEKRVRVKNYGSLPRNSPLLVNVPGVGGKPRRLHTLAAQSLARMSAAIKKDLGLEVLVASGWRKHRWESRKQYNEVLLQRFKSIAKGKRLLAYNSPHETGLAMDIGSGGLTPSIRSRDKQLQTPLHKWLVEHAYEYGWHPYKVEPWHWEFPLSRQAWETGEPDPGGAGAAAVVQQAAPDGDDDDDDDVAEEADEDDDA